MLTSWSEQFTPAELSIASVLMRPPPSANSIRPRWVKPRLPPSPTTRHRSSPASIRTASLSLSPTSALRLGRRLDVGADPAVPQQVHRRPQDRADQLVRRAAPRASTSERARGSRPRAAPSWPFAGTRRRPSEISAGVVVLPRRARAARTAARAPRSRVRDRGRGRGRRAGGRRRRPAGCAATAACRCRTRRRTCPRCRRR